jgi:hypothetical protein
MPHMPTWLQLTIAMVIIAAISAITAALTLHTNLKVAGWSEIVFSLALSLAFFIPFVNWLNSVSARDTAIPSTCA